MKNMCVKIGISFFSAVNSRNPDKFSMYIRKFFIFINARYYVRNVYYLNNELHAINIRYDDSFDRRKKKRKEKVDEELSKISPRISPFRPIIDVRRKGSGSHRKGDTLVNDAATLCDRYVLFFSSSRPTDFS